MVVVKPLFMGVTMGIEQVCLVKNIVTTKTQLTTQLTHINQRWVGVGSLGQRRWRANANGSEVQVGVLIWRWFHY